MEELIQYLINEASIWAPRVFSVIVIFAVFFILAKVIKKLITGAAERLNVGGDLTSLFARTSSIVITIFGIVTALGTLGIDISAMVAGLGLTGFALGFALKDSISNLLSGVLILLYRPFQTGNRIKITGYEGTIISIDLRYTELDSEGNRVLIPNSKLFTDPVTVLK